MPFLKLVTSHAQDAILQGRGYDQLSEEEKNLFERIKTMKLSEFRTAEEREVCRSGSRFGFSPQHHTLVMCPEMAGYPSSAIVLVNGSLHRPRSRPLRNWRGQVCRFDKETGLGQNPSGQTSI